MKFKNWFLGLSVYALGCFSWGASVAFSQSNVITEKQSTQLSLRERALIHISANTASGNLNGLDIAVRKGLDNGLTINQIKALLEQLYAYCGFPRSLNGINTLMSVIDSRTKQGIQDKLGQSYKPVIAEDRYEKGRTTLETLTGVSQSKPSPGFGDFSPEIDRFLKEHLFADIFDNKLLSYRERELITITALASMNGVESQLKAHIGIGKNTGITDGELLQLADILDVSINRSHANQVRKILGQPELKEIDNDMLVRISAIEIRPESLDKYLAILNEEAQKSVELEPGVISIFPMYRSDSASSIRIVEIYRNQAAYESHIASPHFKHYKTSTIEMVKSLDLVDMQVTDPQTMLKIFQKFNYISSD
ncbi:carboxymuconolactone decarboxylase family protein [Shewanella avicenniae]|uniref:Carboxymuconolactone decarboxylase family protein n=1 Tax=Shewanella avicenniae TaxID=2814294 RepID=A0ABX7QKY2_9GAMM|nr:carboxymuconolactone decarboxylase family protein [Shewanella avicenniae]QSX32112.1 carboxymuconolactone decarboxylase family protein [Shewanella avicenniae]